MNNFDSIFDDGLPGCRHHNVGECDECDVEIGDVWDIDKCLNCGRYKASSQLNESQVCKRGCINPNEY